MKNTARVLSVGLAVFAAVAQARPLLVPDPSGDATTEKFKVLDRDGDALGVKLKADSKFVEKAAHAQVKITETTVFVRFVCPVPDGMKPVGSADCAWEGDEVELFFRPSMDSKAYFQYCANVSGVSYAANLGTMAAMEEARNALLSVDLAGEKRRK